MEQIDPGWPPSLKLKTQFERTLEEICIQIETNKPNIDRIVKALEDLQEKISNYGKNGEYAAEIKILEYFKERFKTKSFSIPAFRIFTGFIQGEFYDSIFTEKNNHE